MGLPAGGLAQSTAPDTPMLAIDLRQLPARSAPVLVACGSDSPPEFVLADQVRFRYIAARWRRRCARLDEPHGIDCHLLSYCERGGGVSVIDLDGRRRHVRQHTGGVTFLPAGHPVAWAFDCPAAVTHLHLYIAADNLAGPASSGTQSTGGAMPVPPMEALYDVRDAWLEGFFRLLMAEHEACRGSGRLHEFDLLERLGPLLVRRLHALLGRTPRPAHVGSVAPLRPALLRQVETFVEAHLADRVTVPMLAAIASMSADHFGRAFAQATGSTPHRWILERRLDAVRERLAEGTQSLAHIARECGLAGASHLSSSFRRRFGVTPSAFRQGGSRP